ncbi:MAG: alpha/beta hydrolase [Acetobacteraceae bacterium]
MDPLIHAIRAWDGLMLEVREWPGDPALPPVLGLPGLVRPGADFEGLAEALAGRRLVTLDYAGRGGSARARSVGRYAPEACVRDILDVAAALHVHHTIAVGTSFGGFMAMGLAVMRPGLLCGVVLNDVGPELGGEGDAFVRDFVGRDPALASLDDCVAYLQAHLPPLSLHTEAAWRRAAELTYAPGEDGRWHPRWDTRIATMLDAPRPDLWPLFGALAHLPVLLLRGAVSNILLPETVTRMQALQPDMAYGEVPAVGHAPILTEPEALAAIRGFLERVH